MTPVKHSIKIMKKVTFNEKDAAHVRASEKLDKFKAKRKRAAEIFKFFGENSNVHGLKYVVRKNGSLHSRLFWILMLATSGFCVYILLQPLVHSGSEVSFVPNTLYLDWNTLFPAVTVCESYLGYKITVKKLMNNYADILEPMDHNKRKLLSDILFGGGACGKSDCTPCGQDIPCDFPWRKVIDEIRIPCEGMIEDCEYNGRKFSCCKYFHTVDSDNGPCFAFNSLLHRDSTSKQLTTVNRTTGPGELNFKAKTYMSVFVHGPEELATKYLLPNSRFDVMGTSSGSAEFLFSIVEMESDPSFLREGVDVRKCRYPHELLHGDEMHQYLKYSYGACKLAMETDEMYEVCGCVHPIRDLAYENVYCNLTGIHCLLNYKAEKLKLGIDKHKEHVHEDPCIRSCVEIEMSTINYKNVRTAQPGYFNVSIKMANLPTLRYRQTLFKTDLDLVVTLGGMAGLFFGASILSLAETIYLLIRKNTF